MCEESFDSTDPDDDLTLRTDGERVVPWPRSPRRSADDMEGTADTSADTTEPEWAGGAPPTPPPPPAPRRGLVLLQQ
jgi:hypothetical protein